MTDAEVAQEYRRAVAMMRGRWGEKAFFDVWSQWYLSDQLTIEPQPEAYGWTIDEGWPEVLP